MISVHYPFARPTPRPEPTLAELDSFRQQAYDCITARADTLFELAEAVLCVSGPIRSLVQLCLAPQHRRGHGALYDALHHGRLDTNRLRTLLATQRLPRTTQGRLVLAVDISPWLRPEAATSPERSFCHTHGRGKNKHLMIPGWPYSIITALEPGRTSWTAPLDALRIEPGANLTAVTATQIRDLIQRLITAGHHQPGDPTILIVLDAGYDPIRIAYLLSDLPVQIVGRLRSDRVLRHPAPPRAPGTPGRPVRHGAEFVFGQPATWGPEHTATTTHTSRYGETTAQAWNRLHPALTHRSAWADHPGQLPIIEGTVIRLSVDHLPSGATPKPLWLWSSATEADPTEVDVCWQMFLRRFDIEHTFRLLKQTLGWTAPKLRSPEAADRWTWLMIIVYTQLRLARGLVADRRLPWEKPAPPHRVTPARIRRGFRDIHATLASPTAAPKPSRPGPGRPPGSKNKHPAPRHKVGLVLVTGQAWQKPTHHKKGTKPRRKG